MKKAFTLLELLIVIGLIAILIGLGSVSYSTAQKKARDARRLGDLKAIQNALEQYYSVCSDSPNTYPFTGTGNLPAALTCASPSTTVLTYPKDPLGSNYQCVTSCSSSTYTICPPVLANGAYLEAGSCTPADPNCCVSNQQ